MDMASAPAARLFCAGNVVWLLLPRCPQHQRERRPRRPHFLPTRRPERLPLAKGESQARPSCKGGWEKRERHVGSSRRGNRKSDSIIQFQEGVMG